MQAAEERGGDRMTSRRDIIISRGWSDNTARSRLYLQAKHGQKQGGGRIWSKVELHVQGGRGFARGYKCEALEVAETWVSAKCGGGGGNTAIAETEAHFFDNFKR